MKNIYIFPTNDASRLVIPKYHNTLCLSDMPTKKAEYKRFNMYITSDEDIKENDWCLDHEGIIKCTAHAGPMNHYFSKIVLTTDTKLIADGVQSINDKLGSNSFLQWFVENPTCDFVPIEKWSNIEEAKWSYEINLKELTKPKAETLEDIAERLYEQEIVNDYDISGYLQSAFLTGAKLVKQEMYSIEEIKSAFFNGGDMKTLEEFNYFLENLKNKKTL